MLPIHLPREQLVYFVGQCDFIPALSGSFNGAGSGASFFSWRWLGERDEWSLVFLSTTTKNRIAPTNSNDARNDMVIINLSLLQ
jgi:hypothetical protein